MKDEFEALIKRVEEGTTTARDAEFLRQILLNEKDGLLRLLDEEFAMGVRVGIEIGKGSEDTSAFSSRRLGIGESGH